MANFKVKNFEKFQHYKDRNPPWIKLYNEVLEDYRFGSLQDASKAHLIAIWLLASRTGNELPFDAEWIAKRINATEYVNLQSLADAGFIIVDQPLQQPEHVASKPLQAVKPDARPERERETEGETEPVASQLSAVAPLAEVDLGLPSFLDRTADLKTKLFGPCLDWLAEQSGKPKAQLRSMVGKWLKDWGDGTVLEVFMRAQRESPIDPVAWITAALEAGNAKRNDHRKPTAGQTARAGIAAALLTDA